MNTEIRLLGSDGDGITTIEIERPLCSQGPERLWRALFAMRVQVVTAEVRVVGTRLRERLRVCEFDGAPMTERRSSEVTRELEEELARVPLMRPRSRSAISRVPSSVRSGGS